MNQFKVIKNQLDHEQALARLHTLIDSDPTPESPESDEIEVLALLIEHYEKEHFPR